MCVCVYIYIYGEREREREREQASTGGNKKGTWLVKTLEEFISHIGV